MIAAILLAAGRASRFGAPKLTARLGGHPLATHAAQTLTRLPVAARLAIVSADTPDLTRCGFDCIPLEPAGAPMSRSIALAVDAAASAGADAALIALADMPFVPLAHFKALLAAFDGTCVGSRVAGVSMPPAVFGRGLFAELARLEGDTGARKLLATAPCIELAADHALDIDTPADLERAERMVGQSN